MPLHRPESHSVRAEVQSETELGDVLISAANQEETQCCSVFSTCLCVCDGTGRSEA